MNITLNPETQKLIEEHLKRGGYPTADDLVRAGLESLHERQDIGEFDAGELDELLAEGEKSGQPLDGDKVLSELRDLRARHANKAG